MTELINVQNHVDQASDLQYYRKGREEREPHKANTTEGMYCDKANKQNSVHQHRLEVTDKSNGYLYLHPIHEAWLLELVFEERTRADPVFCGESM